MLVFWLVIIVCCNICIISYCDICVRTVKVFVAYWCCTIKCIVINGIFVLLSSVWTSCELVKSRVHVTNLTSSDFISTDLISSETNGCEVTQFAVVAANQNRFLPCHECHHWIHCQLLRGLRNLLPALRNGNVVRRMNTLTVRWARLVLK